MNIKSSICGIQHTCIKFLIFLIITKIECWPVFKQDPYMAHIYICRELYARTHTIFLDRSGEREIERLDRC